MIEQLCYFCSSAAIMISVTLAYKNITKEKLRINLGYILTLLIGLLVSAILNYFNFIIIKTAFAIFFFYMLIKRISSKSNLETFYYSFLMWLYGMLVDVIVMLLFSIPIIYKSINTLDYVMIQAIAGVLAVILIYLPSLIPILKKGVNKIVSMALKIKTSVLTDIIYVIIVVFIDALCVFNLNKISLHLNAIIIIILLLLLIISMISKNYNIKKLKEINNTLVNNSDFLLGVIGDYRILKHNLTSQLLGIKSVANIEAKKLIDDLILNYNQNYLITSEINKIPSGLNGIVYEKIYSFNKPEINIAVQNNIQSNLLDILKPRIYNNLCETLGVLLDNALEAAYGSDEKSILIDFFEEKEYIYIKIINTFNNEIDIDALGNINVSSKGKNRGIGLFSIFKRNSVKVKTSIYNDLFESKLKIKKALI